MEFEFFFSSLNIRQAKSGVILNISNSLYRLGGGGRSTQKKVAQDELKHILVLEFLRSDDFLGVVGGGGPKSYIQPSKHPSNQHDGHYGD